MARVQGAQPCGEREVALRLRCGTRSNSYSRPVRLSPLLPPSIISPSPFESSSTLQSSFSSPSIAIHSLPREGEVGGGGVGWGRPDLAVILHPMAIVFPSVVWSMQWRAPTDRQINNCALWLCDNVLSILVHALAIILGFCQKNAFQDFQDCRD